MLLRRVRLSDVQYSLSCLLISCVDKMAREIDESRKLVGR